MKKIAIIISSLAVLYACDYDNEEELFPDTPDCETSDLTYDNSIGPLIIAGILGATFSSALVR